MKSYAASPEAMKRAADMAYVQGINFVALTGAVQQATTADLPGLNTWLFSDLDRNNPWFRHADMLVDYLWRCNMMLSRGACGRCGHTVFGRRGCAHGRDCGRGRI